MPYLVWLEGFDNALVRLQGALIRGCVEEQLVASCAQIPLKEVPDLAACYLCLFMTLSCLYQQESMYRRLTRNSVLLPSAVSNCEGQSNEVKPTK
jgi:hypothetical protein